MMLNKKINEFQPSWQVFWYKIEDISGLRGCILMNDGILETLLVVLSIIKNSAQNFWNFIPKFSSKVEVCWNQVKISLKPRWFFSNNSEVSSNLLGHILLFWKNTMQAFQKHKNFTESALSKKFWWRVVVYERCRRRLGRGTH
jgi:hypothetical protein